ncbi:MAG: hypothetical protein KAR65_08705 [Anaerolineales bacterium]|nr:hypothetical protein [Anaerolineales bacterium]
MPELPLDFIEMIIAAFVTVMILSYVIGDNVLFRVATYLFIGVASGFAGAIAWENVVKPTLVQPLIDEGPARLFSSEGALTFLIPWMLVLFLFFKLSPRLSRFGSFPVALLVGVGAAVVVGGSITGTLVPQSLAATGALSPATAFPAPGQPLAVWLEQLISALISILATISVLIYFRFSARRELTGGARRSRISEVFAYLGKVFIAVTFGVMYAGALMATIAVLAQRFQFLHDVVTNIVGGT